MRSIAVRQALFTGGWVTVGLVLMWLWVTSIVTAASQRSFDARLISLVDSLAVATAIDNGQPHLIRPVSEPLLDRPFSGVYFQIEGPGGTLITSRSLGDERLPPGIFGHQSVMVSDIPGPRGQTLRLVERDIVPPDTDLTVHLLVAADIGPSQRLAMQTNRELGLGFGVLALGLVSAVMLQATLGLGSLRRLRGAVAELRAGGEIRTLRVVSEVEPLVQEIEALVQQNRATVERARRHVGNLAHALRTRLSVMRNALASGDTALIGAELSEAERLVNHHLVRARAASLAGSTAADIVVGAVADEIARALRTLFQERDLVIEVTGDQAVAVRCEREDLLEMLGNLMENACKWSRHHIDVHIDRRGRDAVITVSDDGAGLAPDTLNTATDRGKRLDETVPGTGLGLDIVMDLAGLYGGSLVLVSSGPLGGLSATLQLPAARRAAPDSPGPYRNVPDI